MGFGWLFVGYIIGMNFVYNGFTDLISFLFILYALLLLSRHNKYFKSSLCFIIPLSIAGLAYFVFELMNLFSLTSSLNVELITSYYAVLSAVLKLIYTALLLKGIEVLSHSLDIPTIRISAFRNRIFTVLYYFLMITLELDNDFVEKYARFAFLPVMIFGFVCLILNAKLFYSCYMWICLEGEEDMQKKSYRLTFLNRLSEKEDALTESIAMKKREEKKQNELHKKEQTKNKL